MKHLALLLILLIAATPDDRDDEYQPVGGRHLSDCGADRADLRRECARQRDAPPVGVKPHRFDDFVHQVKLSA